MNSLGICVIGCGWIGETHLKVYASIKDPVRIFLCDTDETALKRLSGVTNISGTFKCYEDAIRSPEVHLVDICLPHQLHVEPVLLAAREHKCILLEKPIARSLKEARRIIEAAGNRPELFMVSESWRFHVHLRTARELIDQGRIGDLHTLQVSSLHHFVPPTWRRSKRDMGGGVLIDRGIHLIDALLYLGGPVDNVYAQTTHRTIHEMEGEDTAIGIVRFANGIIGQLTFSWAAYAASALPWLVAYGSKGTIIADDALRLIGEKAEVIDATPVSDPDMVEAAVRHFYHCVKRGVQPDFTAEMAYADLEVVDALYRSGAANRVIALPRKR